MRTTTLLVSLAACLSFAVATPAVADDEDPYAEEDKEKETAEEKAPAAEGDEASGESAPSLADQASGEAPAEEGSLRRSGRMEFDERVVKGQAAKSGAVYLFKRVPRRLPGLVPLRRSYRRRIVEPVLGEREIKPAVHSKAPASEEAAPAEPKPAAKPEVAEVEQPDEPEKTKPKPGRDKKRSRRKRGNKK